MAIAIRCKGNRPEPSAATYLAINMRPLGVPSM